MRCRHLGFALVLFYIVLLIQACVPLTIMAGVTIGGMVVHDQRHLKQMIVDQQISDKVRRLLAEDDSLAQRVHLVVTTYNGVTLLAGQAPTGALRWRARRIALSVQGVRRLINQVTVGPVSPPARRTLDIYITTQVKARLLATRGLFSSQIKVLTERGVVYLMGITSTTQAQMAVEVTRRVQGVKKVVKLFECRRL